MNLKIILTFLCLNTLTLPILAHESYNIKNIATFPNLLAISLGKDCEICLRLKAQNLRYAAFPFDWVQAYNFDKICELIQTHFRLFLLKKNLTHHKTYIRDNYYSINFFHDFPIESEPNEKLSEDIEFLVQGKIVSNYLHFLPQVKEKYNRRIVRFEQIIHNYAYQNKKIIFIRTDINPGQARKFVNIIKKQNSQLDFILAVINNQFITAKDWQIPHVKAFYISKFWKADVAEWIKIFKALKLLPQK